MKHLSPARLFGPLFEAVQGSSLFPDSKTFADAVPRREPEEILSEWQAARSSGKESLGDFIARNFDVPDEVVVGPPASQMTLGESIGALWPMLTREATSASVSGSLIALPHRHVVPGGRFRELYYWDSYFTMLGLARSGEHALVEDMIANFGNLIDRFGHIPNGTRTYYLTRSHPPVFHLMAMLSADRSEPARRRRLGWMIAEHGFWMSDEDRVRPGEQIRRVVRLNDGALLNRYWDDSDAPRDESWREDVALAAGSPERRAGDIWRDIRAAAESGWDFSSRWFGAGGGLRDIRTTRFAPVDLNALLYGLEQCIAAEAESLGEGDLAGTFERRARERYAAINANLWNDQGGYYADFDIDAGGPNSKRTAAMVFPLFCGIADPLRARRTASALESLVRPGGLMTTDEVSGEQWDAPNGWAPLQWIAVAGLRRCGHAALADRIATRWVNMVDVCYQSTGQFFEKYDVVRLIAGNGGEYAPVVGFGWTNGVTLELLASLTDERQPSNNPELTC